jgi:hypothetical protein
MDEAQSKFEEELEQNLGKSRPDWSFLKSAALWGAVFATALHLVQSGYDSNVKRLEDKRDKLYGALLASNKINAITFQHFYDAYWKNPCSKKGNAFWPADSDCLSDDDVERGGPG